jgi:hypothetical protein
MKTNARELSDNRGKRMEESKREQEALELRDEQERAKGRGLATGGFIGKR